MSNAPWSYTPARGLCGDYYYLRGLSRTNLLNCTEEEARKLAAADELLTSLKEMVALHTEPAGFIGKFGKELTTQLDAQQKIIDERLARANAVISKVQP